MEKLSENAERIWKVLIHDFLNGAKYRQLMRITSMKKGVLYPSLHELESKGYVVHKKGLWIPAPDSEKSSTEKPSDEDSEDFKFYIEHGLLTKKEIDVYVNAKTFLKILPENSPQFTVTKLIIDHFQEKLKSLKELSN